MSERKINGNNESFDECDEWLNQSSITPKIFSPLRPRFTPSNRLEFRSFMKIRKWIITQNKLLRSCRKWKWKIKQTKIRLINSWIAVAKQKSTLTWLQWWILSSQMKLNFGLCGFVQSMAHLAFDFTSSNVSLGDFLLSPQTT